MTFEKLNRLIFDNNIPINVHLMSDSGWECSETEMDGVFYNEKENLIVFTQEGNEYDNPYWEDPEWRLIHRMKSVDPND